jgi:hypothetical protein
MSLLDLFSSAAIIIGLCAALPQLSAMLRARSAAGQSSLGWILGALVNGLMSYVNFAGYHAVVLAAGNLASLVICVVAVGLVVRFGTGVHHAATRTPGVTVGDLPTTEFWALRDQLEHEARRRGSVQLAAA